MGISIVGFYNTADEFVTNDVLFRHFDEGNARHIVENALGLHQSAALCGGKIDLRAVARDDHLRVPAHTREEHLDLCRSGVLCFVQNHDRIVECAAAHEG